MTYEYRPGVYGRGCTDDGETFHVVQRDENDQITAYTPAFPNEDAYAEDGGQLSAQAFFHGCLKSGCVISRTKHVEAGSDQTVALVLPRQDMWVIWKLLQRELHGTEPNFEKGRVNWWILYRTVGELIGTLRFP